MRCFLLVLCALITSTACASGGPGADPPGSWEQAVRSVYTETHNENDGEGVEKFSACFHANGARCEPYAFGTRDLFRNVQIFMPGIDSSMSDAFGTYLQNYVSLIEGKRPVILLSPYYFSKNGWIFMSGFSILADGEVILQKEFPGQHVDRNNHSYGVEERYTFIAKSAEIEALRKIPHSKKLSIRITGDKGYVNIKKDRMKNFKDEISNSLAIYDAFNAAIGALEPTRSAIESVAPEKK